MQGVFFFLRIFPSKKERKSLNLIDGSADILRRNQKTRRMTLVSKKLSRRDMATVIWRRSFTTKKPRNLGFTSQTTNIYFGPALSASMAPGPCQQQLPLSCFKNTGTEGQLDLESSGWLTRHQGVVGPRTEGLSGQGLCGSQTRDWRAVRPRADPGFVEPCT